MKTLNENNVYQSESILTINELLKENKRIISFLGSRQSGTSFLVNNIARIMARRNIDIAILDMTSNKDTYYIYTKNMEAVKIKIKDSFKDLSEGTLNGGGQFKFDHFDCSGALSVEDSEKQMKRKAR